MATTDRLCPECNEIIQGRIDKVFCSDYCRNTYHNRKNRQASALIRSITLTLKRNRRILAELNIRGKTNVSRDKLIDKGFVFSYFTHIYKTKSGKTYYFNYDQGYITHDDDMVTLVEQEDYVR